LIRSPLAPASGLFVFVRAPLLAAALMVLVDPRVGEARLRVA
jgi:hypothetical protein